MGSCDFIQPEALNAYFDRLGLPEAGRALVRKAMRDAPVRQVRSNGKTVIGDVNSEKMGVSIAYESRSLEFPAIVRYERDKSVGAFYAQPTKLDLKLTDGGLKRPFRMSHVPDFLVLAIDAIYIDEWRTINRLTRLQKEYPGRYQRHAEGWSWPEVEERLLTLGLTYRLRTEAELPDVLTANLRFLAEYYRADCHPIDPGARDSLMREFEQSPRLTLANLIARAHTPGSPSLTAEVQALRDSTSSENEVAFPLTYTTDDLYKAIASNIVGFDIDRDALSDPQRVEIFRDPVVMEFLARVDRAPMATEKRLDFVLRPGATVLYDGAELSVSIVGSTKAVLHRESENADVEVSIDTLQRFFRTGRLQFLSAPVTQESSAQVHLPSSAELDAALARAKLLDIARSSPQHVTVSPRTLQRLRAKIVEAGDSPLQQHLALIPQIAKRGNRNPKLPDEVIAEIRTTAETHFNKPTNIKKRVAFRHFCKACTDAGLTPCSERTFNLRLDEFVDKGARVGTRLTYNTTPIVYYITFEEPVHGVRSWEWVHIDHTEVDLELKAVKGTHLGKAWLTVAICTATRKIVGFYLSFDPPSYVSCMMVLRDIVRRHGRLPEAIVVDNGKEFHSRSFKRLCKLYGVNYRYRPKGKPRYGSVMERIFGTTNAQFIHNLQGNTQLMKHVRSVTRAVHPENFVEWTLVALHGGLEFFFDHLYGNESHPAHDEAPNARFTRLVHEAGPRKHVWVRYDALFRMETCPDLVGEKSTRRVDAVRGIKVDKFWFHSPAICTTRMHGNDVDVKREPWDPSIRYALVNGRWETCTSHALYKFRNLTEIEMRYALDEMATRSATAKKDVSPERVVEWLSILKPENFDPRLAVQQAEMRVIYAPLNMCAAHLDEQGQTLHISSQESPAREGAPDTPTSAERSEARKSSSKELGAIGDKGVYDGEFEILPQR